MAERVATAAAASNVRAGALDDSPASRNNSIDGPAAEPPSARWPPRTSPTMETTIGGNYNENGAH